MIGIPISGYLYDLIGRKILLLIYFTASAGLLYLLPRTAPSIVYLVVDRALLQSVLVSAISHPLLIDYVKKESRGKAIALTTLGGMVGEALGMAVLFGCTKELEPKHAFFIASLVIFGVSLPFMCIVKEPVIKHKRIASQDSELSTLNQELLE